MGVCTVAERAFSCQPSIDPPAVRAQLERILASRGLAGTASLSRFLRHVVQETLAGRQEGLRELNLGIEIFARGSAFDPRMDPIVRVQARNLRRKLDGYYAGPGASDEVLIELPKGCYVPAFSFRNGPAAAVEEPAAVAGAEPAIPLSEVPAMPPRRRWEIPGWVVACLCLAALLGAGFAWQRQRNGIAAGRGAGGRAASPGADSEAHASYLRGRYLLDRQTEEGLNRSLACFREAVALEPRYAAAWAGIADVYDVMSQFGFVAPADGMAEARKAANRALALDPNLAEAHLALAAILEAYDWNWKAAEREYRRAVELNPALAGAHAWYGMFLRDQGRIREALPELELAYRLDPVSVTTLFNLASAYAMNGNLDAAVRHAKICAEIEPTSPKPMLMLANLYRKRKQDDLAQESFNRARDLGGRNPHSLSSIASVYARTGRKAEAQKLLDELRAMSRQRYVSSYNIAMVYMAMGEVDRAVPYLEAAYRERSSGLIFLRDSRNSAAYRASRRFRELVGRLRFDG
jgi:tetratricopeptide (TPR) repeat protein